jgi:hypothetical protein
LRIIGVAHFRSTTTRISAQFNASLYVYYYHGPATLLVVPVSVPSHFCFFACLIITTQSPNRLIFWDNLHARVSVVYQFNASFYVSYYHGPVTLLVVPVSVHSHICFFACLLIMNQSHGNSHPHHCVVQQPNSFHFLGQLTYV